VTSAHRQLSADLRIAGSNAGVGEGPSRGSSGSSGEENGDSGAERHSRPDRGRLEGLEPPAWIDE
jgi:hypothetical protein